MQLTGEDVAMRDCAQGGAVARAMDLLVGHGERQGAEKLVKTHNLAGTFNVSTFSVAYLAGNGFDRAFSELNPDNSEPRGVAPALAALQRRSEEYPGQRVINFIPRRSFGCTRPGLSGRSRTGRNARRPLWKQAVSL